MKKTFSIEYFFIGILFIWASILAFRNPEADLVALTFIFAMLAFVKGLLEIFRNKKINDLQRSKNVTGPTIPIVGIIDLLVGIFFLINVTLGVEILPFIFAVWFICDALVNLKNSNKLDKNRKGEYYLYLFINIISIIFGAILLVNPIVSALTLALLIGIYLMVAGISYIILSF